MKRTMFCTVAALAVAAAPLGAEAENAFPTDVAPTRLTPEQEQQAEGLLEEARGIYADILDDSKESKADYLNANLAFIGERIERSRAELGAKNKELAELNRLVMERRSDIERSAADEKTKAMQRIQLVQEFRNRQEALEFRIGMLERHIGSLERRQSGIKAELGNIGLAAKPALTGDEAAKQALDRIRRQEQKRRTDRYR